MGSVTRKIKLGETVDTEKVEAAYDNGVLTIVLPCRRRPSRARSRSRAPRRPELTRLSFAPDLTVRGERAGPGGADRLPARAMLECCHAPVRRDLPLFTLGQVAEMLAVRQAFRAELDEFGVVWPSRWSGGPGALPHAVTAPDIAQLAVEGVTLAAIRRVLRARAAGKRPWKRNGTHC